MLSHHADSSICPHTCDLCLTAVLYGLKHPFVAPLRFHTERCGSFTELLINISSQWIHNIHSDPGIVKSNAISTLLFVFVFSSSLGRFHALQRTTYGVAILWFTKTNVWLELGLMDNYTLKQSPRDHSSRRQMLSTVIFKCCQSHRSMQIILCCTAVTA